MELNSSQKLLVKSKHDIANVGIACADLILPLNFLRLLIPAARRRGSRRPRQLACSALLAGLDVHPRRVGHRACSGGPSVQHGPHRFSVGRGLAGHRWQALLL